MVAHTFPPFSSVGHSIRVVKFIKYLPALGWHSTVLTIDDQHEYQDCYKQGSQTLLADIPPEVSIYRTTAGEPSLEFLEREKRYSRQNWLTAVIAKVLGGPRRWVFRNLLLPDWRIAWLPFALRRGRQIVKNEEIDVLFATCPPHSVTLVGAFLKLLTGKPLVLDFRDDWVGTPRYYSRPAITRMIERRLESWVVKTADKVILVTEWSRNAFRERYPSQPVDKFILIPNGVDLAEFTVLNSIPTAPHNHKFTILHAGSLNDSKTWTRSPATLFQAIHIIMQQQPELADKLTVVFAGDFPEGHRRLAEKMGLSGVVHGLGYLPHDQVLCLTKSADLLLAMNYEGFSTLIPGKIYEYWAAGGPSILLLSCPGAATSFVEQHHLGFTVDPSDVAGIQKAILTAYQQSKRAAPLGVSTVGIEAFDRQALTRQLAQVLSKMI